MRQALDEVIACGTLAPSDSYTIQAEYPDLLRLLDGPNNPGRQLPIDRLYALFGDPQYQLSPEHMRAILDVWRFWKREPERSRRVIRLAVANWLAYYELPPDRRPQPDPDVPGPLRFYAFGPEAPANARALSPGAMDHWLATSIDATPILRDWNPASIRGQETRGYRALVVLLASELYRRDHGTVPLWDEALVGPYLKELPDDGLDDGARPTGSATVEATRARESNGRGN
jgi:hypothetical protein